MDQEIAKAASIEEVIDLVKSRPSVIPRGGGTKPSLWNNSEAACIIDMTGLSGIVEYLPSEYTITVKSGTRLSEVVEALAANGQYLPFDPPLAFEGATIGGSVAAGLSGPGAYRYGPLKDFIIGVKFVDGSGNWVKGGGKVVKNAAGFDFPKLFNGSMGRLGILTEVSFKVFPEPQSYVTLQAQMESVEEAVGIMPKLTGFDLEGVELDTEFQLSLRLGYQEPTMESRQRSLQALVGKPLTTILGDNEPTYWENLKRFAWMQPNGCLVKTATHPHSARKLKQALDGKEWKMHLGNGGKALYLGGESSADTEALDTLLKSHNLTGLQLKGPAQCHPLMGTFPGLSFVNRVQGALDPRGVFQTFSPSSSVLT